MLTEPMENTGERMIPERSDPHTFWEHIRRYQFATQWAYGKSVLDIASGEGYGSFGLLRAGAASVVGVDVDVAACLHASTKYGVDARVGSAEDIPVRSGSIDLAVSFETIEHVQSPDLFIQELCRVLSPGGTLIISTPNKDVYSGPGRKANPFHCSEMSLEEFRTLLGKSFPTVSLFGQGPSTARWWSPLSLISENSPWDRSRVTTKARRSIWALWNPERVKPLREAERRNPEDRIYSLKKTWGRRFLDWFTVRPLSRSGGWSPTFVIAVARKRDQEVPSPESNKPL